MKMKRYNKTTASVLAGAAVTALASVFVMNSELQGALQTILAAVLVWLVPNRED